MKSDDIYRIILTRMWGDEKFNRLSSPPPNGKYLWIFLCTGPFSNRLGLFKAGEMTLAEELGWELKGFREAFQEALVEGLLKVSDEYSKDRLIFIPNFLKINFPANPNVIKSWEREWNILPECGLKLEAWHHIKNLMESKDKETKAWSHAFTETCRKPFIKPSPKPLPKTSTLPLAKQEQEQEQEQEENNLSHSGKNLNVTTSKKRDYSPEFELAWKAYPQRAGSNDKRKAYQAWNARLKEGHSPQAIIEGITRYGLWCKTTGKIGTESVKQTSSFLGKADPFYFLLDWGTSPRRSPDGIFKSVDPSEPVDKDGYPRPSETCPVSSGWVLHDLEKTWGYRLEPLPGQVKGTWIDEPRRRKQVAI